MELEIKLIRDHCLADLNEVEELKALDNVRIKYLGKKGTLTIALKGMGKLSSEERPIIGKLANEIREEIEQNITQQKQALEQKEMEAQIREEVIDVSLPGKKHLSGNLHPLTTTVNELKEIFLGMGFTIEEGPEIEWTKYNFDYLNVPKEHSARDLQDTFYYKDDIVLRTQTSPVQVRVMQERKPPLRMISPGRVYRTDEVDATHSPVFHQMEGLVIDKGITMGDLKGTLDLFAKKLFGEQTKTKFRPHQFYFTEPSAEMDVTCFKCGGVGCKVCSNTGWIEVLGCGMVHPNVLKACGIDPDVYSGFAFGLGLDRIAITKYGITDLRLLFENDLRFLSQFK
ncbi:phenylalanine--tRNA ligase subunit alpha [Acetobacterium paludosum]|uniref:Phenylalanine--tRNA ligase alpha subunit n=1 Tax=Acetobacterium paludosum TaxID=52693 RepID=A0A923HW83_9FIRM|nr:phenylalanine--tRNA ligase subunit alpha [Acetobacterium paludosum]MBC3889664.1 phenylalanine--tRNA ligase subunit alpha [Acetobacterium paludosum]